MENTESIEITPEYCSYNIQEQIIPFFKSHIQELNLFLQKKNNDSSKTLTIELLIQFIEEIRLPFDMRQYMNTQSDYIKKNIKLGEYNRQEKVNQWIQKYAEKHRSQAISLQCLYLEKTHKRILPEIKKLLQDYQNSKQ